MSVPLQQPAAAAPESLRADPEPKWYEAPVIFLVHTVVGSFIFGLIAIAAVGLGVGLDRLEELKADPVTIGILRFGEYLILVADMVVFGRYLFKQATRAWMKV